MDAHPDRYAFIFQDECEFHLNPSLSRMWGLKGQPLTVDSAGQNKRVPVFGGLDAQTGKLTILLTERKRTADFLAFLRLLLKRYTGRHIFLFLDNCSIHWSKAAQRFFADHAQRITPVWNAAYTPELNRIERYWGHLKARATNNYFFGTEDNLRKAIRKAVTAMNRSQKLRMNVRLDALHSFSKAA